MNQMEPEEVSGLDDEALVKKAKDKIGEFYTELKDPKTVTCYRN